MSYILDALRRADAERERDPARGIHAQPAAGAPAAARGPVPGWTWPVAALAVVGAVLVFAWQRPTPESAAPQVAVAVVPPLPAAPAATPVAAVPPTVVAVADVVSPPPPPMPLKAPVERVKPTAVAAARPHAPAATPAPAPVAAANPAPATAPAPAPAGARAPAVAPATAGNVAPGVLASAKLGPAAAAPANAPVATAAANRVFNPAELPADVQGALPKLAITGGVYSENAAQRMLVVGGQVVNEGAELAPGVVLDQIRSRSAVLRFRGYRYAVSY